MTWLTLLKYALQIVVYLAQRSERMDIQKAALNELEKLHGQRTDKASDARDDVLSGRVQPDDADPYRRD